MVLWATLREKVRRTILADTIDPNTDEANWTDEQLLDCAMWALDEFTTHTAYPVRAHFSKAVVKMEPDVRYNMKVDREFLLPNDMFGDFESQSRVLHRSRRGEFLLDPLFHSKGKHPQFSRGYYLRPGNRIVVEADMEEADELIVDYFAHYPFNGGNSEDIAVPRWAEMPLAYLIGAHAMTSVGIRSANINQWKNKDDSGNPEHNAFRAQQKWLIDMYERGISRHSSQDRINAFRSI